MKRFTEEMYKEKTWEMRSIKTYFDLFPSKVVFTKSQFLEITNKLLEAIEDYMKDYLELQKEYDKLSEINKELQNKIDDLEKLNRATPKVVYRKR